MWGSWSLEPPERLGGGGGAASPPRKLSPLRKIVEKNVYCLSFLHPLKISLPPKKSQPQMLPPLPHLICQLASPLVAELRNVKIHKILGYQVLRVCPVHYGLITDKSFVYDKVPN